MNKASLICIKNIHELDFWKEMQVEYAEWVIMRLAEVHACRLSSTNANHFRNEVQSNFHLYSGHLGKFFMAVDESKAQGMAGLKYASKGVCELKRLYVSPPYRRAGLARLLVERQIDEARTLGYNKIRIETLDFMVEAIQLYESFGFLRTTEFDGSEGIGYGINGHEVYFSLDL